jgi:hypothetical protein
MLLKQVLFTLSLVTTSFGQLHAETITGPFSWSGVTRDEYKIQQAAFFSTCPTGPEYTNVRLINYTVDRSDSKKKVTGERRWTGWGTATCAFDRIQQQPDGTEELPNLNGPPDPWTRSPGGSTLPDDSDQLGNP